MGYCWVNVVRALKRHWIAPHQIISPRCTEFNYFFFSRLTSDTVSLCLAVALYLNTCQCSLSHVCWLLGHKQLCYSRGQLRPRSRSLNVALRSSMHYSPGGNEGLVKRETCIRRQTKKGQECVLMTLPTYTHSSPNAYTHLCTHTLTW